MFTSRPSRPLDIPREPYLEGPWCKMSLLSKNLFILLIPDPGRTKLQNESPVGSHPFHISGKFQPGIPWL